MIAEDKRITVERAREVAEETGVGYIHGTYLFRNQQTGESTGCCLVGNLGVAEIGLEKTRELFHSHHGKQGHQAVATMLGVPTEYIVGLERGFEYQDSASFVGFKDQPSDYQQGVMDGAEIREALANGNLPRGSGMWDRVRNMGDQLRTLATAPEASHRAIDGVQAIEWSPSLEMADLDGDIIDSSALRALRAEARVEANTPNSRRIVEMV